MLRYNKLKELNKSDAYLIISEVGRYYITGFKSSFGYVIYDGNKNYYLTDYRYYEEAIAFFEGQDIEVFAGNLKEIESTMQSILLNDSIKTIGYEDNKTTYAEYSSLKKLINKDFVPLGNDFDKLRIIKDEFELLQIESAQKITDKAFSKVLGYIKNGITEKDIKIELEYQMFVNGADALSFDTIIASGSNSSRPHSSVTNKKINNGELILMDFGAKYNGYCSDMTRTVSLGKPDEKMKDVYDIVLKAQNLAINALKAKLSCLEIYSIAKEYLSANGYGDKFLHGLGHGVGLEIHEGPTLNSLSSEILENNTVITIEPGVYIEKEFGIRIEDLIIVKDDGIKNLTNSKKELIII